MPFALYLLALVVFAMGTSEFMLAGLVPPIAADLELTTRTAEPNSRAAATAVENVLDSAADRWTATTPSPPLSASAFR